MLDWEDDVRPMINETMNARDAALLAEAWDSGVRSGELQDLTLGNVSDHKHGLQITVDGKQGQRSVMLIKSVPLPQPVAVRPSPPGRKHRAAVVQAPKQRGDVLPDVPEDTPRRQTVSVRWASD